MKYSYTLHHNDPVFDGMNIQVTATSREDADRQLQVYCTKLGGTSFTPNHNEK